MQLKGSGGKGFDGWARVTLVQEPVDQVVVAAVGGKQQWRVAFGSAVLDRAPFEVEPLDQLQMAA